MVWATFVIMLPECRHCLVTKLIVTYKSTLTFRNIFEEIYPENVETDVVEYEGSMESGPGASIAKGILIDWATPHDALKELGSIG